EEIPVRQAEFTAFHFAEVAGAIANRTRRATRDRSRSRPAAEELLERGSPGLLDRDQETGVTRERLARDAVPQPPQPCLEVTCILGQVDRGHARRGRERRRLQKVEPVLEVLLVDVNDVGAPLAPFSAETRG